MESLHFTVGDGINDIIRQAYWFEEPKKERQEWAMNVLKCFKGLTIEQAQQVLNGEMKFTPNPEDNGRTMLFVPDNDSAFKAQLTQLREQELKAKTEAENIVKLSPFIPENEHGHFAEFDERDTQAWVAPNGMWYNVGWGDHQGFAWEALAIINGLTKEQKYSTEHMKKIDKAGDELVKLGWILVERDIGFGVVMRGYQNMNKYQFNSLHEVFGDEELFRGWTVTSLYYDKEEARKQAEGD